MLTVFVLDDQDLFHSTTGTAHDNCWVYGIQNVYVNRKEHCGTYLQSLSNVYTFHMDKQYLLKGTNYRPYWWDESLYDHVAGFCYKNVFKGSVSLKKLFDKEQAEPPEAFTVQLYMGF